MFHKGSMRLVLSSFCVLEAKNYFTLIFTSYNLQYGNKTAINVKKLPCLKRDVRAINHTYKTAPVAYLRGGGGATAPSPLWSDRKFFWLILQFCRLHFATEPYKIRVQRHGRLYCSMLLYRRPCQTRGF